MAYEKQTWQTGDVVTSAKLNHMEDGIAGGGEMTVIPLEFDNNVFQTSVTWQTIKDLVYGGNPVGLFYEFDFPDDGYYQAIFYLVNEVMLSDGTYSISAVRADEGMVSGAMFIAASADSKAVEEPPH